MVWLVALLAGAAAASDISTLVGRVVDEQGLPLSGARVALLEAEALASTLGGPYYCDATWGAVRDGLARAAWVDALPQSRTDTLGRFVLLATAADQASSVTGEEDLTWPALVVFHEDHWPRVVLLPTTAQVGADVGPITLPGMRVPAAAGANEHGQPLSAETRGSPLPARRGRVLAADGAPAVAAKVQPFVRGADHRLDASRAVSTRSGHAVGGYLLASGIVLRRWAETATDGEGGFDVCIPNGTERWAVWGDDIPFEWVEPQLDDDGSLALRLSASRVVEGVVRTPDGRPVGGGQVLVAPATETSAWCADVRAELRDDESLIGFLDVVRADDLAVRSVPVRLDGTFSVKVRSTATSVCWLEHDALWTPVVPLLADAGPTPMVLTASPRESLVVSLLAPDGTQATTGGVRGWIAPAPSLVEMLPVRAALRSVDIEQLGDGRLAVRPPWLDGGTLVLLVPGYRLEAGPLTRAAWSPARSLRSAGGLRGRLVNDEGQPLPGVDISVRPFGDVADELALPWRLVRVLAWQGHDGGALARATSDAAGRFEIDLGWAAGLQHWMALEHPAGTFGNSSVPAVRAKSLQLGPLRLTVPAPPSDMRELGDVVLEAERLGALAGHLVDDAGAPLPGELVRAWTPYGHERRERGWPEPEVRGWPWMWAECVTDADGRFSAPRVGLGRLLVEQVDARRRRIADVGVDVVVGEQAEVLVVGRRTTSH